MVCVCTVAQLCLTLCDPMARSPPGSSVHKILKGRIPERVAILCSRDLPDSGIKPESLVSPAVTGRFFTTGPPGKPCDIVTLWDMVWLSKRMK